MVYSRAAIVRALVSRGMILTVAEQARAPIIGLRYKIRGPLIFPVSIACPKVFYRRRVPDIDRRLGVLECGKGDESLTPPQSIAQPAAAQCSGCD